MLKKFFLILCVTAALFVGASAMAQQALVVVPKGKLNMRKAPKSSASIVIEIPRDTFVEVISDEGEWCQVSYKNKTGYVKSEYLIIPGRMEGREVYSEGGLLLLRAEESDTAALTGYALPEQAVRVISVGDEWAKVSPVTGVCAGREGYVPLAGLLHQYTEPQSVSGSGHAEAAVFVKDAALYASFDTEAEKAGEAAAGTEAEVLFVKGSRCMIRLDDQFAIAPVKSLCITGIAEELPREPAEKVTRLQARQAVANVIFTRTEYETCETLLFDYTVCDSYGAYEGPVYHAVMLDQNGKCLYAALVDAQKGKVLSCMDVSMFSAAPAQEKAVLPEGTLSLSIDREQADMGDILCLTAASAPAQFTWEVLLNGQSLRTRASGSIPTVCYVPRKPGLYTFRVTAVQNNGKKLQAEVSCRVSDTEAAPDEGFILYSQRDGRWYSVPYADRNLSSSGCAIFALSHALQLMGVESERTEPGYLANKFKYAYTEGGTNTELLVRGASKEYGFTTQPDRLTDPAEIADHLRHGDLFMFSVAKGHIALIAGISEDGTKVRVIDSCPSATFERATDQLFYQPHRGGDYTAYADPAAMPGLRYYFELENFGGAEYYLSLDYAAERGVRLIEP